MSKSIYFTGTGVAMITPFNQEGEVDYGKLGQHADRLIRNGISYLVVLGTTAETPTLSSREKTEVIAEVVKSCGSRIPVIAGAGGNDTRGVVEGIRNMDTSGVDGLLTVAPYYNKPSQEGLYQHFSAIAAVSEIPLMLYNVPGRTGSNIAAETTLRLAHDFPGRIVSIKEASGDLDQVTEILRDRPEGFSLVSGDDAISLPLIACGGEGLVSVIGNAYPAMTSTMVAAALDGVVEKSRELHYRLYPMMKAIFREGNPAGVKAAMEIRGWIENVLRLPLIPVTERLYGEISRLHSELV